MDNYVIVILNIQNTDDPSLELDLSRTYLVNGKNNSTKIDNPNSISLMSIPKA
ncbi:hypothetical protein LGK95_01180 [Clostridium algoriphilum]|uniref:hypothetical protein n=1 Tax=Clostridium algoriphilum TaxID=198347 RepID=UPI001CF3265A|nr:hypothetical protein [Clostridium algoriphilum]MCB2292151.1 hypothetical protein [Clostridium algoriphilum]